MSVAVNLTSKEEAFRFVMCEAWNEMCHINSSLKATISIECAEIGFMLHLQWQNPVECPPFTKYYHSQKLTLTQLCNANFSMTSWLRTFIHESKIQEDCPVRDSYAQEIARQTQATDPEAKTRPTDTNT